MADAIPVVSVPIRITLGEPLPGDDAAAEVVQSSSAVPPAEEITAETLTVIETAAAVFLAKNGGDPTAKTHPASGADSDSWTHQGRDIVQASHNLVQRGH
jgi:hypothetical protein